MSDDNQTGTPAGTPASPPPPGYPGAAASQPSYPQPSYPQAPAYSQHADQGQYGAPAYPQQQQPYGYGAPYGYPPKTNSLAIVSLVSGIAAFVVLPLIASIVAVITGHMSLKQLKTNGEAGSGMALAGTILGWVGIAFAVLGIVFVIFIIAIGVGTSSSYYDYS